MALKGPEWSSLRFGCEVHYDAGTFAKVYELPGCKTDITGMIQTTLALNAFGQIVSFRESARKALADALELVDDIYLDQDALDFKELVLDTFVAKDAKARGKR